MSLTKNNVSYHDLNSLQNIRSQSRHDDQGALRQAAEQFEAIFMNMLLSSMRKANEGFEAEGLMNSQTTKFYRDMHDNQLATELAQNGSLGLADLMVQQLSPAGQAERYRKRDSTEFAMPVSIEAAPMLPVRETLPTVSPDGAGEAVIAARVEETDSTIEKTESVVPWDTSSPAAFIRSLLPAAKKAVSAFGLDPLALVAQAALETGWGQRMIKNTTGQNSFNLFGIKANNGWQGDTAVVDTLEYRQGVAQKEKARFRAYESPEQSLSDYIHFINNNSRYQDAVKSTTEPGIYFAQLQAAGYATDPEYARKIMSVYQSPAFEQVRAELQQAKENTDQAE